MERRRQRRADELVKAAGRFAAGDSAAERSASVIMLGVATALEHEHDELLATLANAVADCFSDPLFARQTASVLGRAPATKGRDKLAADAGVKAEGKRRRKKKQADNGAAPSADEKPAAESDEASP